MTAPTLDPNAHVEFRPELDIRRPDRQRRWTVLLRGILLIPQFIALYFLAIAAGAVLFVSWFCALVLGRLPAWSAAFLGGYLGYSTRVNAYAYLLVDTYPPFQWAPADHPVSIELAPGRLNRLAVFFRLILVIPAVVVTAVVGTGWATLAFFVWLIVLVLGRTPQPVFDATAAMLRYTVRTGAYYLLLTSAYPKRLFGDEPGPAPTSDTRPLRLSSGGRALLIVFIVLGVLGSVGSGSTPALIPNHHPATTVSYP